MIRYTCHKNGAMDDNIMSVWVTTRQLIHAIATYTNEQQNNGVDYVNANFILVI